MKRFQRFLIEEENYKSPYHEKLLAAGYKHEYTGKLGDSRGDTKVRAHGYSHPTKTADEHEGVLKGIFGDHEHWVNNKSHFGGKENGFKLSHTSKMHNFFKKSTKSSIETETNNDGKSHRLVHTMDHK